MAAVSNVPGVRYVLAQGSSWCIPLQRDGVLAGKVRTFIKEKGFESYAVGMRASATTMLMDMSWKTTPKYPVTDREAVVWREQAEESEVVEGAVSSYIYTDRGQSYEEKCRAWDPVEVALSEYKNGMLVVPPGIFRLYPVLDPEGNILGEFAFGISRFYPEKQDLEIAVCGIDGSIRSDILQWFFKEYLPQQYQEGNTSLKDRNVIVIVHPEDNVNYIHLLEEIGFHFTWEFKAGDIPGSDDGPRRLYQINLAHVIRT